MTTYTEDDIENKGAHEINWIIFKSNSRFKFTQLFQTLYILILNDTKKFPKKSVTQFLGQFFSGSVLHFFLLSVS